MKEADFSEEASQLPVEELPVYQSQSQITKLVKQIHQNNYKIITKRYRLTDYLYSNVSSKCKKQKSDSTAFSFTCFSSASSRTAYIVLGHILSLLNYFP